MAVVIEALLLNKSVVLKFAVHLLCSYHVELLVVELELH